MPDGMPAIFCHFSHLVEDSVRGSLRSRLVLGSQNRLLVLHLSIDLSHKRDHSQARKSQIALLLVEYIKEMETLLMDPLIAQVM